MRRTRPERRCVTEVFMSGALQIVGALFVLAPFAALQIGGLRSDSSLCLWPNLLGAGVLAVLALLGEQ